MNLNWLSEEAHKHAAAKGFWGKDGDDRNFGEIVANLHSEVSEMWDEYTHGRGLIEVYYEEDGKPCGIPVELADLIIRAADVAGAYGIDLEYVIQEKMDWNRTRPFMHGKKA